jgi:DNA mismatch endonuclease, patch repair protein
MRAVRSEDTSAEIAVRRALHQRGLRFRLHVKHLPGTPDIVLPRHKLAILVHGCFWHGHSCRQGSRRPSSNKQYWNQKLLHNRSRDARVRRQLRGLGWRTVVIWECELRMIERLVERRIGPKLLNHPS